MKDKYLFAIPAHIETKQAQISVNMLFNAGFEYISNHGQGAIIGIYVDLATHDLLLHTLQNHMSEADQFSEYYKIVTGSYYKRQENV